MKYPLLAATAVSLSLVVAPAAHAEDVLTSTTESIQRQMDEMRAQMAQMAARMQALEAELAATKQAATVAQAQAGAAAQAATAAQAQAGEATQVAQQAATDATSAKERGGVLADAAKWAADTKISGRMYYNISSISAEDALGNDVESDGGFALKRFYLGVDHKFNDTFSGNITTDVTAASGDGAHLYVKKAYLEAKIAKELKLRVGAADMPWIPYAEGIYGYRHIEKTLTDLDSFGTSSDWGVHASGDLADGHVSYQVSAINGAGYKTIKPTKSIDLEGRLSVNYGGFNAAVGGYTGKLGMDVQGAMPYRTASRFNALLAYKDKVGGMPVTFGGEYFTASNWKVLESSPEDKAEGYSLFASLSPVDKWSVFGRYDWIQPFKKTAPLKENTFFMLGLQYSPAKIVDFAIVYKRDDADGGLKIGNLGSGQATRDEIGLYGQFRF